MRLAKLPTKPQAIQKFLQAINRINYLKPRDNFTLISLWAYAIYFIDRSWVIIKASKGRAVLPTDVNFPR